MRFVYVGSAEPEWIALFILAILLAFSLSDRAYANKRTVLFRFSVIASMAGIASNIVTIMCWPQAAALTRSFVYGANEIYFIVAPLAETLVCVYVLAETYAATPGAKGFLVALCILLGMYAAFLPLVLTNARTGLIFVLGKDNAYARGSASWFNMVLVAADVLVVTAAYFIHRRRTDPDFRVVMVALPMLALGLSLFQQFSPQTQLSGTTMALTLLVLFITCQRRRVNRDTLTDAGAREALFAQMTRLIELDRPFTLQLVGLRRFRRINRRFGLTAGDAFLRAVAQDMARTFPGDMCYRFSGADFAVLHPHAPDADSAARPLDMRERFSHEWEAGGARTMLNAAFAQVSFPEGGQTREELINGLEYCLLLARQSEDNTPVVFGPEIRERMLRRESIAEAIQSGIREDRFFLCYQPIYDARTGAPCAAEALLRLRDADGTVIPPGVFIPLAEENGSIVQLTWVVLGMVCAFLDRRRDQALPPVSINFSTQQFAENDMCEVIARYLEHYRLAPGQIKIEITERVFSENSEIMTRNVRRLREMGVGLYLDDFGTGYSNLASMSRLPFEVVKVDKSLLAGEEKEGAYNLLAAVVDGLRRMGAQVLMEGVETAGQAARVKRMGVDRLQGYLYARPMEEDAFLRHLAEHGPSAPGGEDR